MHRIHITLSSKSSTTFPIPPSYGNDKNPHGEGRVGETSSRELNQSNPIHPTACCFSHSWIQQRYHTNPGSKTESSWEESKTERNWRKRKRERRRWEREREGERERTLPNKWRSKSSLMVSLLHTKMKPPRGSIRATAAADSLLSLAIPLPPPAAAPPLCFGYKWTSWLLLRFVATMFFSTILLPSFLLSCLSSFLVSFLPIVSRMLLSLLLSDLPPYRSPSLPPPAQTPSSFPLPPPPPSNDKSPQPAPELQQHKKARIRRVGPKQTHTHTHPQRKEET